MGLRRCPTCKRHLVRWGGRLLCQNAQCPGSPLEPDQDQNTTEIPGQLTLPDTTKDAA